MNSTLDARVREYKFALDRKDELAKLVKLNNELLDELEQVICQMMVDEEKPSTVVDGFTYSLNQKTMYSKKSEAALSASGIDFFETLREQGLGDLIVEKVDPRTLQSSINAMAEAGDIPEELLECLNVYEKLTLSKRKANTSALDRARANRT